MRESISLLAAGVLSLLFLGCGGSGNVAPPDPPVEGLDPLVTARVREATEAVRADPGSAAAWGRLGEVYDVHRLVDQAIQCYDRATALDPESWKWDYFAGLNLSPGDPQEAARRFERALSLEPGHAPLWLHAGWNLLLQERFEKAESAFARVLELEPGSVNARLGFARIALARNDPDGALPHLDEAARIAPSEGTVHRHRAQALLLREDTDGAREAEQLAATSPNPPQPSGLARQNDPVRAEMTLREGVSPRWLRDNTSRLLAQGRSDEALARLEEALSIDPDSVIALVESARVLERLGRIDDAIELVERSHRIDPENAPAWTRHGLLLVRRGEDERAVASLRRAVELDPDHIAARVEMGLALWRTGNWETAIAELEESLQRSPASPAVAAELAWALATCPVEELRQPERARKMARLLCQRSGYLDVGYMDVLAAAQAASGEYGKAVDTARKALALIAGLPETAPRDLRERMQQLGDDLDRRRVMYEAGRPYLSKPAPNVLEQPAP